MGNIRWYLTVSLIAGTASVACGNGEQRLSPTSPSVVAPASAATDTAAGAVSGQRPDSASWAAASGWTTAANFEVEGTDVITATSNQCPNLVITVRGIPVTLSSSTEFAHNDSCALLAIGQRVKVRGVLQTIGGQFVVQATRIDIEHENGEHEAGEVSIGAMTGACPNLILTVHGVRVLLNSSTVFQNGACADLRHGTKAFIEATGVIGGLFTATLVRIVEQPGHGEGEGVVSAISGACPSLTMQVGAFTVMTFPNTDFHEGHCSDIHVGTRVEVKGDTSGTTVFADRINIKGAHDE